MTDEQEAKICLGAVVGAHGVRGLAKVKPFTDEPEALLAYGPLSDEQGRRVFTLALRGRVKDQLLVAIEGVRSREEAAALRGERLYVARSALPPPEDPEEFYHADLIGLAAVTDGGVALGRVSAVQNFGAGDLLEITAPDGSLRHLPFTRAVVPEVDVAAGRLVVVPPVETAVEPQPDAGEPEE